MGAAIVLGLALGSSHLHARPRLDDPTPLDLAASDLGQDLLRLSPRRAPRPTRAAPGEPFVIYLNFSDGTENLVKSDGDNAVTNETFVGAVTRYPTFAWPELSDGSLSRADIIRTVAQRVHEIFLPYNVLITVARPTAAPYTMVMIGGSPTLFGFDARVAGLSLMDCNNDETSNVVFAFPSALRGSLHGLWVTISHEAAHSFGLEHTSEEADVMFPRVDPAQHHFLDSRSAISGQHLCGNETQSSHQKLLAIVGAWPGGEKPLNDGSLTDEGSPRMLTEGGCVYSASHCPGQRRPFLPIALLLAILPLLLCRRRASIPSTRSRSSAAPAATRSRPIPPAAIT